MKLHEAPLSIINIKLAAPMSPLIPTKPSFYDKLQVPASVKLPNLSFLEEVGGVASAHFARILACHSEPSNHVSCGQTCHNENKQCSMLVFAPHPKPWAQAPCTASLSIGTHSCAQHSASYPHDVAASANTVPQSFPCDSTSSLHQRAQLKAQHR